MPPVNSAGNGQAELQWNRNSNVLSWKVTFTGLSGEVTGAHIHGPASPGENAGVVIPFMTGLSGTITGQTNLTNIKRGKVNYVPYRLNYNTFVSSNTPDCFIGFKIYGSTGAGTNVQAYEGVSVMAVDSPTGGRQE